MSKKEKIIRQICKNHYPKGITIEETLKCMDKYLELVKEYLFNTAKKNDNISETYLKQTIKFLESL